MDALQACKYKSVLKSLVHIHKCSQLNTVKIDNSSALHLKVVTITSKLNFTALVTTKQLRNHTFHKLVNSS